MPRHAILTRENPYCAPHPLPRAAAGKSGARWSRLRASVRSLSLHPIQTIPSRASTLHAVGLTLDAEHLRCVWWGERGRHQLSREEMGSLSGREEEHGAEGHVPSVDSSISQAGRPWSHAHDFSLRES